MKEKYSYLYQREIGIIKLNMCHGILESINQYFNIVTLMADIHTCILATIVTHNVMVTYYYQSWFNQVSICNVLASYLPTVTTRYME